jgi:hypothetical protein
MKRNGTFFHYATVWVQLMKMHLWEAWPHLPCNVLVCDADMVWLNPHTVLFGCGAAVLCATGAEGETRGAVKGGLGSMCAAQQ